MRLRRVTPSFRTRAASATRASLPARSSEPAAPTSSRFARSSPRITNRQSSRRGAKRRLASSQRFRLFHSTSPAAAPSTSAFQAGDRPRRRRPWHSSARFRPACAAPGSRPARDRGARCRLRCASASSAAWLTTSSPAQASRTTVASRSASSGTSSPLGSVMRRRSAALSTTCALALARAPLLRALLTAGCKAGSHGIKWEYSAGGLRSQCCSRPATVSG